MPSDGVSRIFTVAKMNAATSSSHPAFSSTPAWYRSGEGIRALEDRARDSIRILSEAGLIERLHLERERAKAGGAKVFRIGNSLRSLSTELTILVLAHASGLRIPPEAWETGREIGSMILALDNLSFQGRNGNPPTRADLWTADLGVNVAAAAQFESPLEWDRDGVARFLEDQCLRPIRSEWLDDATRIHSLDSMGHNWWSVIVGGAGIVASLMGRSQEALDIVSRLNDWFRYPGNPFGRKTRNFGPEGDFVEGFGYGEYALLHPFILAFLEPTFSLTPAWLDAGQLQGLAFWLKKAFLKNGDGSWWPQRFGDIHFSYRIRAEVWHTLARLTGDGELLDMAHRLKPQPGGVFEFLMWEPLPSSSARPSPKPSPGDQPRIFPTSGLAFLGGKDLSLTVRAGEFWNHNHQDAGSFILHQDGVVWVDDCGCCTYSQPEYVEYYRTPRAHNVAGAPELIPPDPSMSAYEGMPLTGRHLFHGRAPGLQVLGTDTGILSGGGLARSLRVFLVVGDAATVIWDDLQAHRPQSFEFLLHSTCEVDLSGPEPVALRSGGGGTCPLSFFSENPAGFSQQPAAMGELPQPDSFVNGDAPGALQGRCLKWLSAAARRQKFGLAMGTTVRSSQWLATDSGWENTLEVAGARWSLWFNRKADGSVMHENPIAAWQGFETDAYALALRQEAGKKTLYGIQASFVRSGGKVISASSERAAISWAVL